MNTNADDGQLGAGVGAAAEKGVEVGASKKGWELMGSGLTVDGTGSRVD